MSLAGNYVAMVTNCVMKMIPTCPPIIEHFLFMIVDKIFKQTTADDDPAGIRWINSHLIGFTYKMKNTKAKTDTT